MEPILNSWKYFTFPSKNISDVFLLKHSTKVTPSYLFYLLFLSMIKVSPPSSCFSVKIIDGLMGFHLTQVVVYSEVFSHTEKSFFIFFPGVHLSFIGWGSYRSEISLEVVIIPLFLSARRKGIITRKNCDNLFLEVQVCVLLFLLLLGCWLVYDKNISWIFWLNE